MGEMDACSCSVTATAGTTACVTAASSFIEENNVSNASTALMAGLTPETKVLRNHRRSKQEEIETITIATGVEADEGRG